MDALSPTLFGDGLADMIPVALCLLDPTGHMLQANIRARQLLDRRLDTLRRALAPVLEGKADVFQAAVSLPCDDGSVRLAIATAQRYPQGILVSLTDPTIPSAGPVSDPATPLAHEARERLAAIVDGSEDAIIGEDLRGVIQSWNHAAERMFGYSAQEAIGKPIELIVPPGQPGEETAILQYVRQAQRVGHFETVRRRKDGSLVDVSVTASPIRDPDGEVVGVSKIARDVSAQKRAEAENDRLTVELRRRVDDFETLLNVIPIGIAVGHDPECRHVTANRTLARWIDVPVEANISCASPGNDPGFKVLQNGRQLPVAELPLHRAAREGTTFSNAQLDIVTRAGRTIRMLGYAAPLRDEAGHIRGSLGAFVDMTDRLAADEAQRFLAAASALLASSLDYQTTLSNVARLAVPRMADWCAVDILEENTGVLRRVAVVHSDPAKVRLADELYRKYPPRPSDPSGVWQVLRSGAPLLYPEITEETLAKAAHDAEHLAMARRLGLRSALVVPLLARGRTLGAITFVYAESDRRYASADLPLAEELGRRAAIAMDNARLFREKDQANRAKDQFLAVLSHELRTPLTPVLMAASSLEHDPALSAESQAQLAMIRRNIELEARIIDDLLDLTRIARGKLELRREPFDASATLEHALSVCEPAMRAKNIRVVKELKAERHCLFGDPARIEQVFWNLVNNAGKFTPAGGSITITMRNAPAGPQENHDRNAEDPGAADAGRLLIEVHDTGMGIEPDLLPRLFNAFEQGQRAVTRQFGGLGLGLAICKAIVQMHGGTISARSPGRGRGATFSVSLPLARQAAPITPSTDGPSPGSARSRTDYRVLLVEDHTDTARIMARLLETDGYRVTVAHNVADALAAAGHQHFDLLVSDVGLPDGTGTDLMRQLRSKYALRGIALSGFGMEEDIRRSKDAGFEEHLTKPVKIRELEDALSRLLR